MTWTRALGVDSLPEPNSVAPVRVADTALLLTRDEQGTVRAFENQCPHQFATLCREPQEGKATVECPNHYWVFSLDGTFLGSRISVSAGRTVESDPRKNLREVPCRVRNTMIEVAL